MARLIPRVDPNSIENNGERIVAQALVQQLPADCVVYHSFPWLRTEPHAHTGKEYLQPGEADFVLVHPQKGVLIVEVKGGTVEYDAASQSWNRRHGTYDVGDPFLQAEKNKYVLRDLILDQLGIKGSTPPFTIGHAVAFPHSRYSGTLPAHVPRSILFDADDLTMLERKINQCFDSWCRVPNPRPLDAALLDAIQQALSPVFQFTPVLWRTIDDQEERIKRLTNSQARLLDMLRNQERAAIEGVAGSGKTILAVAQAQRFARQGLRTLLVCYNRPLADWLAAQQPEQFHELLHVDTFHGLCARICRLAGIAFPTNKTNDDFWIYEAAELFEQAAGIVAKEHGYDAIVVDEGQDFQTFWWEGLQKLYRDTKGPLYVFYDPKQNIYVDDPLLPAGLGHPYVLPTNCRNTQQIAAHCGTILGITLDVLEDAPKGNQPKVSDLHGSNDVIHQTRRTIQEWCLRDRGGLQPSQVAILVPQDNPALWPATFGNIPMVRDFDQWRANKGILLATHRRFKGLESDALVLAGVPEPDTKNYYTRADHYVACSRAKHLLEIIFDRSL